MFDSDASSSFSEEEEEDKLVLPAPGTGPLADMAASSDDEKAGGGSDEDEYDDDRWNAAQYHATRNDRGEADSDDEEAAELELEEAKRLQRKARERLAGGDFGVESDEEEDADAAAEARGASKFVDEDSAEAQEAVDEAAAGMTEGEAIAHLLRTQPETLALVDDFVVTASKIKDVERDLEEVRTKQGPDGEEHPARAVLELEYRTFPLFSHSLPRSCRVLNCCFVNPTRRGPLNLSPPPRLLLLPPPLTPRLPLPVAPSTDRHRPRAPFVDPSEPRNDGGTRLDVGELWRRRRR